MGAARRRRGARRADDRRDGRAYAPRLRARLGGRHAAGRRAGNPPHRSPARLRQAARRAAADGERAGRSLRRVRGGHGHRDAARAGLRPSSRGRRGGGVRPHRHGDREVLGLQARARPRCRGARMPRRQRLRRGVRSPARVPAAAAPVDLGGQRQRHLSGRAPGAFGASPSRRPRCSTRFGLRTTGA